MDDRAPAAPETEAGRHEQQQDVQDLASGVYVLRLTGRLSRPHAAAHGGAESVS